MRYPLEHPPTRLALIRQLAEGTKTQTELAAEHGVTQPSISQFAAKYAQRVQAVRADLDNEYAGISYADTKNRVEMLAGQIDFVAELLDDPERQAKVNVGTAELVRAAQQAAHAISEELGQLPARGLKHEGGVSVRYVIEGVDPDAYA